LLTSDRVEADFPPELVLLLLGVRPVDVKSLTAPDAARTPNMSPTSFVGAARRTFRKDDTWQASSSIPKWPRLSHQVCDRTAPSGMQHGHELTSSTHCSSFSGGLFSSNPANGQVLWGNTTITQGPDCTFYADHTDHAGQEYPLHPIRRRLMFVALSRYRVSAPPKPCQAIKPYRYRRSPQSATTSTPPR
jgi:hypothetical protein